MAGVYAKPITTKALDLAIRLGMATSWEVLALYTIARSLRNSDLVVNIGAGFGVSSLAFREARPDLEILSIDRAPGGDGNGGLKNERNAFQDADLRMPTQILGNSATIGLLWKIPINCLYVDGGHLRVEVEGDILAWGPRVVEGGLVLFHDYGDDTWPDVKLVVDHYMKMTTQIFVVDHLAVYQIDDLRTLEYWGLLYRQSTFCFSSRKDLE